MIKLLQSLSCQKKIKNKNYRSQILTYITAGSIERGELCAL